MARVEFGIVGGELAPGRIRYCGDALSGAARILRYLIDNKLRPGAEVEISSQEADHAMIAANELFNAIRGAEDGERVSFFLSIPRESPIVRDSKRESIAFWARKIGSI